MLSGDPRDLASLRKPRRKSKANTNAQLDVDKFVSKLRSDLNASWRKTETWRRAAEESYLFVEGKQWDAKVVEEIRNESPTRPILTFNDILPVIRILSGIERQAKETFKILPRQGADVNAAQMMTECFRYVTDQNLWFYQRIRKSNDVNIAGKGYVKVDISYEKNVLGDIVMKRKNPFEVFEDVMSEEWDGSDRRWCGDGLWVNEDEAKELWPEFEDQINFGEWLSSDTGMLPGHLVGDPLGDISLFIDKDTRRVRIFDYWYKRREVATIMVNAMIGDAQPATEAFLAQLAQATPEQQALWKPVRRPVTTVRVATFMNWILLQDKESPLPFCELPITPYFGLQFLNDPSGIVEHLKDPARLKNKAISQGLNHLNRSANSGWLNHATEGADETVLQKFGSTPGVTISYKSQEPKPIHPAPISTGHFTLAQMGENQIRLTSLVNAELSGTQNTRVTSGKAIQARQQGGLVGNEDLLDNGLLGDKVVGMQVIECIRSLFPPERVQEIVDVMAMRNNQGFSAQVSAPNAQLNGQPVNLPALIQSTLSSNYDYAVDREAAMSTARQAELANIRDVIGDFAQAHALPPLAIVREYINRLDISPDAREAAIAELQARMQQPAPVPGVPG